MSTATLDRSAGPDLTRTATSPPVTDDPVTIALRKARLAEVSAETADWIAGDLVRREASGAGSYEAAVSRIRLRASRYRTEARRQRSAADRPGATGDG
jgi:hypothetical protein